ncbi:MAG: flavodoxin family protein [Desulfurococcus sp.]|nr:flavodoxin family protein [Desulfurococcus sp.]
MKGSPHVLIINGSPRRYGSSMQLARIAAKGVEDAGGTYEIVNLYEYSIKPCLGCVSDNVKYCRFPCIVNDDDFNSIARRLLNSHGLIVSTPVYWYAPSGVLKNFIDRLTSLENMIFHEGRSLLEGKVAGFIATGLDSGVMMAISYLAVVLNSMGVHIVPWSMAYSHSENIADDEQALRDAYNVGYIVVETARALMEYGRHIGYNPSVNTRELRELVLKYSSEAGARGVRGERLKKLEFLLSSARV